MSKCNQTYVKMHPRPTFKLHRTHAPVPALGKCNVNKINIFWMSQRVVTLDSYTLAVMSTVKQMIRTGVFWSVKLVIHGYSWLFMVIHGYSWLFMVILQRSNYCYRWVHILCNIQKINRLYNSLLVHVWLRWVRFWVLNCNFCGYYRHWSLKPH